MTGNRHSVRIALKRYLLSALALLVVVALVAFIAGRGHADTLGQRKLLVASSLSSATTDYTASFVLTTSANIGSLSLLFCVNSPLVEDPCTAPAGLDISTATASVPQGLTDMTVLSQNQNSITFTRTSQPVTAPLQMTVLLQGVVNPSQAGSYYARVQTYGSTDTSGVPVDSGGFAFAVTSPIQVSTKVPPYLAFCTAVQITSTDCGLGTGSYIDFGNAGPGRSLAASSQFVVATNSPTGYEVQVSGNTLTSGNNVIPALVTQDVSRPGVSQFGMNLRGNTDPAVGADPSGPGSSFPTPSYDIPDRYRFVSGDTVANSSQAENYRKFTVSYIVNVSQAQPVGVYVSTMTYVAAASF